MMMAFNSRSTRLLVAVVVLLAGFVTSGEPVYAQAPGRDPQAVAGTNPRKTFLDWGLPAVFVASTLVIPSRSHCVWCDRDSRGIDALNGFDRSVRSSLRWDNIRAADKLSWITEFSPLVLLVGVNRDRVRETALPVFQAFGTTYFVTHVVKVVAARERPIVHFGGTVPNGANASFFSGHSSGAFSVVFALARVNADRDDPSTKWIWMAGVPLAAATGYLRVAADKHYVTDVLTGAAVGAALGWSIPMWWRRSGKSGARIVPTALPGGANLSVTWRW